MLPHQCFAKLPDTASMLGRFPDPIKDESLWFKDGNIVLQAENTLFKVHMSMLARESGFFESLQDMKQPEGKEDGTEAAPLRVLDVSAKAFSNVLHIAYLPWGDPPLERKADDLIEVAHAAQRYQFDRIFNLVVQRLCNELPADRRLELALAFEIKPWIKREFTTTVLGFDTVPLAAALDARTVSKIWKARHKVGVLRMQHAVDMAARRQGRMPQTQGELCIHLHMGAVRMVAETPRELFLKALKVKGDNDQFRGCTSCKQATQAAVEAFAGSLQEELRLVQAIWDE